MPAPTITTSKCSAMCLSRRSVYTSVNRKRAGSIIPGIFEAHARPAEGACLGEQAQGAAQRNLQLGGGKAARVGDDLHVDIVGDVLARRQRRAAAAHIVRTE